MSTRDYRYRLLVYLAKSITEGKIDKTKLVDTVIKECFSTFSDQENEEKVRGSILKHLDLLLDSDNDKFPLVGIMEDYCLDCDSLDAPCLNQCPTEAISRGKDGNKVIDYQRCVDCGHCVNACISGSIILRTEFAQVAAMLYQEKEHPVYAILAPSFVGQFSHASPQQTKAALLELGFTDVYEVAMAADMITVYEAQEFAHRMATGSEFMITSCCCPAFIKLVEKIRPKTSHLISDAVSPMIALGKMLKNREPFCRVVFIGPCVAKKSEARLKDLQPAVDCVLTFKETSALFDAADISLTDVGQETLSNASFDGRAYAVSGGVSSAITRAVKNIDPGLELKLVKGNGLKECNELLKKLEAGKLEGNFMEGMGCPGGCVGGPGCNIPVEMGTEKVKQFANQASIARSYENKLTQDWDQFTPDLHSQKNPNSKPHSYH